jgi:putative NADPH-quinone reductase
MKKIVIIQGHPDSAGNRFGHALAAAYAEGAGAAGHELTVVDVARLDFPMLRTKEDFDHGESPASLHAVGDAMCSADHIAIFFPLWLGTMPALLKAFFEQVFRPHPKGKKDADFAYLKNLLRGKTGHIVVTMGMPAAIYRWYFRGHGVRGLERSILRFCGMGAIRESLIGMVEAPKPNARLKWLRKMEVCGRAGI